MVNLAAFSARMVCDKCVCVEVFLGQISEKSDVYAFSLVLGFAFGMEELDVSSLTHMNIAMLLAQIKRDPALVHQVIIDAIRICASHCHHWDPLTHYRTPSGPKPCKGLQKRALPTPSQKGTHHKGQMTSCGQPVF